MGVRSWSRARCGAGQLRSPWHTPAVALLAFSGLESCRGAAVHSHGRLAVLSMLAPVFTKWELYLVPGHAQFFCFGRAQSGVC